jgi:hypothetical protein
MSINNPQIADRVRETSVVTAPGTGSVTLTNVAVTGYQTFASQFTVSGTPVQYCIVDPVSGLWEIGIGTYAPAAFILSRTATYVYSGSSGAGTLVNFTNGSLDVYSTINSQNAVTYELRTGGQTNRLNLNPPLNSAGNSGSIQLLTTQATTGSSASISITPAAAPITYAASPGAVTIISGKGGWVAPGGAVTITAGAGGNSGTAPSDGGAININGGASGTITGVGANGGNITLTAGQSTGTTTSNYAGSITLAGGTSNTGALGGDIVISSGRGTALTGTGGQIYIYPGSGNIAGGGTDGTVHLQSWVSNVANADVITIKDNGTVSQLSFFNKTPIAQPTTAITATAAFVVNSGTAVNTGSTFGGYTLAQIVTALQSIGLLT